jgi:hypothetical protein
MTIRALICPAALLLLCFIHILSVAVCGSFFDFRIPLRIVFIQKKRRLSALDAKTYVRTVPFPRRGAIPVYPPSLKNGAVLVKSASIY